jgi:hypothetical protein
MLHDVMKLHLNETKWRVDVHFDVMKRRSHLSPGQISTGPWYKGESNIILRLSRNKRWSSQI